MSRGLTILFTATMMLTLNHLPLEAKPGGGFWEIFDESGDGVRHATVIFADRGRMLRFDGPLGFNGHALQMVHTYAFERFQPYVEAGAGSE